MASTDELVEGIESLSIQPEPVPQAEVKLNGGDGETIAQRCTRLSRIVSGILDKIYGGCLAVKMWG